MDSTTQAILAGIVRHVLTGAAGMLVTAGYLQQSQTEQFIGAGVMLAGIAWSWWQKSGQAAVAAELAKMKAAKTPVKS